MIKNWLLTGDCHGQFDHFYNLHYKYNPEETVIIILGDVGLNFSLDNRDEERKEILNSFGYQVYCVRGNHEFRPEQVFFPENIEWDSLIKAKVYKEDKYPNIKYFFSGGSSCLLNNKRTYIIDGAYSVDAPLRKYQGWPWNPLEQLSELEKIGIECAIQEIDYDLILSHTCPITWQPTDLFQGGIDQKSVDNSMEFFLEKIADIANWKTWCWGHFHETRKYEELEGKPGRNRIMIFQDFIPLEEIVD